MRESLIKDYTRHPKNGISNNQASPGSSLSPRTSYADHYHVHLCNRLASEVQSQGLLEMNIANKPELQSMTRILVATVVD